jgi:GTP-binding protein LepA
MTVITTVQRFYFAYTKKNPETPLVVNNPTDLKPKLDRRRTVYIKQLSLPNQILWNVMSCVSKTWTNNESNLTTDR